jgi:hypothetical protein
MTGTKIKAALIRLQVGIKNSDGAEISTALDQVEAAFVAHREELPPQLVHFLAGRSYAKALAFLGGGEEFAGKASSPPGGCGGGHA